MSDHMETLRELVASFDFAATDRQYTGQTGFAENSAAIRWAIAEIERLQARERAGEEVTKELARYLPDCSCATCARNPGKVALAAWNAVALIGTPT